MKTLTETIDAIKAIDTNAEIILTACLKVLGLTPGKISDPQELAVRVSSVAIQSAANVGMLIDCFITNLAINCALQVKEGYEKTLLEGVVEQLSLRYANGLVKRLVSRHNGNTEEVKLRILSILG